MEVKFAASAAFFADFNINIGANAAGAQNGGEICRDGGKFRRLVHASQHFYKFNLYNIFRLSDKVDCVFSVLLEPYQGRFR